MSTIQNIEDLEPWLLDYVPESGRTALDVGANMGAFSRFLAKRFEQVIAFEPQPNITVELPTNVVLNNVAVGDEVGELELHLYRANVHASGGSVGDAVANDDRGLPVGSITVPITTLDAWAPFEVTDGAAHIDFIKIDVEGMEVAVIRGALDLLMDHKPILLIECHAIEHRDTLEKSLELMEYDLVRIPHPSPSVGPGHSWLYAH